MLGYPGGISWFLGTSRAPAEGGTRVLVILGDLFCVSSEVLGRNIGALIIRIRYGVVYCTISVSVEVIGCFTASRFHSQVVQGMNRIEGSACGVAAEGVRTL